MSIVATTATDSGTMPGRQKAPSEVATAFDVDPGLIDAPSRHALSARFRAAASGGHIGLIEGDRTGGRRNIP